MSPSGKGAWDKFDRLAANAGRNKEHSCWAEKRNQQNARPQQPHIKKKAWGGGSQAEILQFSNTLKKVYEPK